MEYGLIGERLIHSYSCEIHKTIADYKYELCEIKKENLAEFLEKRDFKAINVTIPYKESVIPFLDSISQTAEDIGAVNTIVNREGKLCGYNTDFLGMRAGLERFGIDISGKKVLILGTGGTSKTANAVAKSLNASEIIFVSRSEREDAVSYLQLYEKHRDAQIIINTTPVGMYPNENSVPVDISAFNCLEGVFDVIYNPLRTRLVMDACRRGIKCAGGLYMLSAQAVYASALFLGNEPDASLIDIAYNKVKSEKQNIVLIGMPTSGKSSVGKKLAETTGKVFFDTDEEIVSKTGESIPDIFANQGEKAFRKKESEVISELSAKSGCVIATGGGAVLDRKNVNMLKRNSVIVFLDRPLELLISTEDRPLSSNRNALEVLYKERYGIYKSSADIIIDAGGTTDEVAQKIFRETIK